ncbi:Hsp20/alpha crystallin family protein [Sulfuracidifex tepidarius]|uniref:SHSP domain-containing protein n=2 Tax=Sulfuracidifex tepidarius TaxID=1294262 RepID=A0A510DUD9_9CREN|nr:hypothetical protein [Sulfuracidifex tepidarius]BBG23787.1 hypothetical protein IC006_1082 [Sulfuracidifex tepidarius]BBG26542.1 hypothetical protein IC007_1057 [Sulfuracidifex tepidarius]
MPVYKDLNDMMNSIIRREIANFQKEMENLEREFFSSPLLDMYACEDHYDCIVDVPYVDPTSIYMKVEGNLMKFKCKDKMGNVYQAEINLPEDADSDSIKVERVKWVLRIRMARKST